MEKRTVLISLASLLLATGLVVTGYAAPAKPIELRFSTHLPAVHPYVADIFVPFIKEVEKRTGGRVTIKLHPAETLVKLKDQYDFLLRGGIDIAFLTPAHYAGRFYLTDSIGVGYLLPYDAVDKGGKDILDTLWEKYFMPAEFKDVKVLWWGRYDALVFMTRDKPVRKLEDLRGLLIGNPGGKVHSAIIKALGGTPEVVPVMDAYLALERRMIDAQYAGGSVIKDWKLYEVVKYVTMAEIGASTHTVYMNKKKWEALPPDIKEIMTEVGLWAKKLHHELRLRQTEVVLKTAKDAGVEIIYLPPAEMERWRKAAEVVVKEWVAEMEAKRIPARAVVDEVKSLMAR